MMYLVKCLLSLAVIAVVDGELISTDTFPVIDGRRFEVKGMWFIHGIESDSEFIKEITCLTGNITKSISGIVLELHVVSPGDDSRVKFLMGLGVGQEVRMALYIINDDGSWGPKLCDFQSAISGNVFRKSALPSCQFGKIGNVKALCVSRSKDLTEEDKENLNKICPSNSTHYIQNNC